MFFTPHIAFQAVVSPACLSLIMARLPVYRHNNPLQRAPAASSPQVARIAWCRLCKCHSLHGSTGRQQHIDGAPAWFRRLVAPHPITTGCGAAAVWYCTRRNMTQPKFEEEYREPFERCLSRFQEQLTPERCGELRREGHVVINDFLGRGWAMALLQEMQWLHKNRCEI